MAGPWEKFQPVTVENATGKEGPWAKYAATAEPEGAGARATRQLKGGLEAAASLATGTLATPAAGLAGISQGITNLVVPGQISAADRVQQVQNALTYQPTSATGQNVVGTVAYPFEKLAQGADVAGGAITDVTGSPALGAQANTAVQSVPLLLGRIGLGAGADASAAAARAAAKLKTAQTDAATTAAKEAGFSLPPSQVNPSIWNKIVEGFAGKIKTAQDLSLKNQPVGNDLVRQGLGLPEDAPLTKATLASTRKQAGQAYERVRDSGTVTADPVYAASLDKVAAPFERAAKDFPDAARRDVLDAVRAARRDSFDASSAVDQISILRDKADSAYAAKDKKLGRAYKDIAGALEDQLGRHLKEIGAPDNVITDFQNARQTIAKTYTVEKHLQPDGNVNMQGLAADLKRGKPLSGELKTVAEFGANFPKAAQLPEKIGGVPQSPWDHYFTLASGIGGVASGHPTLALAGLAPYGRPLLRKLLTSQGYQNTFVNPPSYGPSVMSRLQQLQRQPIVPALEMAEGQQR